MNKKRSFTTLKTPLLNDCTNHLALQVERSSTGKKTQQKKRNGSCESPIADIVTYEFIRGYN
ncbi:MAG: hypothetical protein ACJAT7_000654 [Psychromonas sp.]|jgi:hypothetical protein|uniref:hypothetical protein n=1 Tax=Psychromonas sp. TaxID=1884585 RepID=UPI0039E4478F